MLRRLHFLGCRLRASTPRRMTEQRPQRQRTGAGGASFLPPAPWWSHGASSSRAPPTLRGGALVTCACRRRGLESRPRAEAASRMAKGDPDQEA